MSKQTKILSGASYQPWAAPEVGGVRHAAMRPAATESSGHTRGARPTTRREQIPLKNAGLMTAAQLARIEQQAHAEGFARGHTEGLAAGKADVEARAVRLDGLLMTLARPLDALDAEVIDQLFALAVALARQLVRREFKTDPGEIVVVVREAVSALPAAAREVSVRLHPEDAALLRDCLSLSEGARPWGVVEDPVLARGDCRVSADISRVDATLETRLNAVVSAALGGERASDGQG